MDITKLNLQLKLHLESKGLVIKSGDGFSAMFCNGSWCPIRDEINMNLFAYNDIYTMVLMHELTHSTGHHSRLDRQSVRYYHDKLGYRDAEEAIADLTTVFLLNHYNWKSLNSYPIVERIVRTIEGADYNVNILHESKRAFEYITKNYLDDFKYNPNIEYRRPIELNAMAQWVDKSSYYITKINENAKLPVWVDEAKEEEKSHEKINRAVPDFWQGNADWRKKRGGGKF